MKLYCYLISVGITCISFLFIHVKVLKNCILSRSCIVELSSTYVHGDTLTAYSHAHTHVNSFNVIPNIYTCDVCVYRAMTVLPVMVSSCVVCKLS